MMRSRYHPSRTLLGVAAFACAGTLLTSVAGAEQREVVPGITYEQLTVPDQVYHIVRVRQGPLIGIRPVLTGGAPTRRAPLTSAMRSRLGDGAVIGVNGDYFNLNDAYPSGLLMTGGEIVNEPEATRAALVFGGAGRLTSAKVVLTGTWQASDPLLPPFAENTFIGVNRPSENPSETIIYTPAYGDVTATGNRVDAIITMDNPAGPVVNAPLTGVVHSLHPGGGTGIGPGKLVISGIGTAGDTVLTDLVVGRRVTINFSIPGLPADTTAAIGGGPALVEKGVAITTVNEGFSSGQINTRTSRTAIGQTADGTVLLVTAEGPFQGSRGISMVEQAELMASLGAQTAVGMDGGGSAAMALRDNLVIPWASERAITNAVVVTYAGVQLTEPALLVTPNGDGVDDATRTTVRSSKTGTVKVTLARANGSTVRTLYRGTLGPSGRRISLTPATFKGPDGHYRIIARFTPSDGSARTNHSHTMTIDRTLGFLRISKLGKGDAAKGRVGFRLDKKARVTALIKDSAGGSVRLLFRNRRLAAGNWASLWDLTSHGKRVEPGIYTVILKAQSPLGVTTLTGRIKVTKLKKPPTPDPVP